MQITIKLVGALRLERFKELVHEVPEGTQILELIEQFKIPRRILGIVLINGLHATLEHEVQHDDTVSLLPILGGG